jgi:ABC-type sugar transport system permease subunit/ABC-type glycerol-3-phosphate transport system substrate-binding protein
MRGLATRIVRLLLIALVLFPPALARADAPTIVLRFRYWGDVKEIAVIHQTILAFQRDHPGVIVHGERVNAGDEYLQKLLIEQTAGLTPDVIFAADSYAALAGHGILMNLMPLVKADPTVHLSDYYPGDLHVFTLDGKLYALPRDIAPEGLIYYNKTLFDKAHIPYPDGSWSWDYTPHPERGNKDFLTVAQKLTHIDSNPGQSVFGYGTGDTSFTLNNLIYSSGADVVDNIFHPTKVLFNDPRVVKAMQFLQDLSFKYDVAPSAVDLQSSGVGASGPHGLFAQGRIAMYCTGIWEVPRFRQEITNFDWDIAPFPAGPTGLHGVATGWSGYGISASTKHKQLAWEFVKYLSGPNGMSRLAQAGLAQPAMAKLADSPLWLDNARPKNRVLTVKEVPYVHFSVISPLWPQIASEVINPKEQLIWNDTLTAQQAVDEFQPAAQAMLDSLNHPPHRPNLNWWSALAAMVCVTLTLVGWVWAGARRDIVTKRRLGGRSEVRAGWLFISPWIFGAVVFLLAPMLVSLVLAFSSWDMLSPAKWVGLGNFSDMAADPLFSKSLEVTLVYVLFSVPLGVAGALVIALLLNTKIRGQQVFRTLYYLPSVTSLVAASLIWLKVFDPEAGPLNSAMAILHLDRVAQALHLTDPSKGYVNWLGSEHTALASLIIMSIWGVGGGMVIFLAGLQGIPQSYYDAADVDGANVWQKFWHVTCPLLTPTIFFSLIMGFIGSFQVFTQGFVMTQGGPNNATLFYVLYLYQNAFQYLKMGYASALAWILFLIILAVTIIQMRMSRWVYYEGAEVK